jgi:hypothetical protein
LYFLYLKVSDDLAALFEKPDVNLLAHLNTKQSQVMETVNERLFLLSDFWHTGFHYFLNELKLDNILSVISIKLYEIVVRLREELLQALNLSFAGQIQTLTENLQIVQDTFNNKRKKKANLKQLKISDNESITFLFNEIKEQIIEEIKQVYKDVPESSLITDNFSLAGLFSSEQLIRKQKIPAKHIVEEIITNDLLAEIYRLFDLLDNKTLEFNNKILNYNRLLQYSIDNDNAGVLPDDLPDVESFLESKQQNIQMLKIALHDLIKTINNNLNNAYLNIEHKFQLFSFKKEAQTHSQIANTVKNIRFSIIHRYLNKAKQLIDKQIELFWYEQSRVLLFRRLFKNIDRKKALNSGDVAYFVRNLSLNKNLREQLPFYYRYLFLNKELFNKDFWFNHTDELLKAKEFIKKFDEGIHGALIVTGTICSGKSFFIHKFIENFTNATTVYKIVAQREKNIGKKTLNNLLQKVSGITGSNDKILDKIPAKSIIVIENLELWWQKTPSGTVIINRLIELIKKYGSRHMFVLSMDIDSYQIIYRTSHISTVTAEVIYMQAFTAKKLQDAILYRHHSSGLKFVIEKTGKRQDELKAKEWAHIFYQYFKLSTGNIGLALNYWMANIVDFDGDYLKIKIPKPIDDKPLNSLSAGCLLILSQFLYHKYLTINNLSDILQTKQTGFVDDFEYLIRTGVLLKKAAGLYQINPAIYIPIREKLIEKGLLIK